MKEGNLLIKKRVLNRDIPFRKLIENSYSGITMLDKDLDIIYRSPAAERINGWSDVERDKIPMMDLVHQRDKLKLKETLEDVLAQPSVPHTVSFRARHYLGHYIWLECTFCNMLKDYNIKAIVCNSIDITDKIQADEMLNQTIKEMSAYKYALDESAIVIMTDDRGIIRHVNRNFCQVSKCFKEDVIGKELRQINSAFQDEELFTDMWSAISKGKTWKNELKNQTGDGGFYWVDTTIVPFLNLGGKPYRYVVISQDITERKSSEEKIIESEKFIKTLTDNLPAMVAYFTTDRRCLFANKAYANLFGKQSDEMLNINRNDLICGDNNADFEVQLSGVLRGENQTFEHLVKNGDGNTTYLHVHYMPDMDGNFLKGYYSFVYDISDLKYKEIEIDKKNTQIENLLETITDGFITLDEHMRYTYANRQIGKILGLAPQSLIGKNIWELFPDAVGSETYHAINKAIRENKYICKEDYYEPLRLWQENRIYPANGGVSIFIRDITKQKYEEHQKNLLADTLTESLRERNTILESIGDAFFAVDKNWVVTYWNNMAERVLNKVKTDVLERNLWEVYADAVGTDFYRNYHQAIDTNRAVHFEAYYESMNTWYEVSAYPSENGLSVYFKDVTERKLSELKLIKLNQDLEKHARELAISNAELEQFAYVASHDLQEPLRMITSFLTQLEKRYGEVVDERGKKYIYFAVDGAKRMRQIILDLLDFSRVGHAEEEKEDVDLNKVVCDLLALYRKKIEDRSTKVTFSKLPVLHVHQTPIRQVFQNLISNALKYQRTDVSPVVKISSKETATHWEFSVKDHGMGICAEYYDKIFIIFQRLHQKTEHSGTGMGLAITKKIVESLGGKIWVESEEGKGSIFYFTISKNH